MKKTHFLRWTILAVTVCFILGVAVAAFMYDATAERRASTATLALVFDAAAEGKTPAGETLNIRDMMSDEIISTAAAKAGVSISAETVRRGLYIAGVYPPDMAGRIGNYISPLDTKRPREADVRGFHPTLFHVTLYKEGAPELTAEQRTALLGAILDTYREKLGGRTEVTALTAREPNFFSGDFVKKALKTALPFSALGLMVCLVILIRKRSGK